MKLRFWSVFLFELDSPSFYYWKSIKIQIGFNMVSYYIYLMIWLLASYSGSGVNLVNGEHNKNRILPVDCQITYNFWISVDIMIIQEIVNQFDTLWLYECRGRRNVYHLCSFTLWIQSKIGHNTPIIQQFYLYKVFPERLSGCQTSMLTWLLYKNSFYIVLYFIY